ncbi:MAG: AAA family ATPase [Acetobacteraceae bacterium]|nr:AAA family ATPase [Acetobacteraceae bacterium]
MPDTALLSRISPAAIAAVNRAIAIASGKGGVGKTWFSVTLAHALARRGRRVLLFDGDLGLANVNIQLGLHPEHDIGSVIAGQVSMCDACRRFAPGGFDVLAGQSGSGALAGLDAAALGRVLDALGTASEHYDHVLLDLGAGVDRVVRRMSAWADLLLVIATDEPSSTTDAYATIKLHAADRPEGAARIVINHAMGAAAGQRTYATLARACQVFLRRTPPLAGIVRRDGRVPEAIRRQALLLTRHPSSPAAEDVEQIAAGLM